jgi:hypothetical protein
MKDEQLFWSYFQKPLTRSLLGKKPSLEDKSLITRSINTVTQDSTPTIYAKTYFYHALVLSTLWVEQKVCDPHAHQYETHLLENNQHGFSHNQRYYYFEHTVGESSFEHHHPATKAKIYLTKAELCLLACSIYQKSICGVASKSDIVYAGKSAYRQSQVYFEKMAHKSALIQKAKLGATYFDSFKESLAVIGELHIFPQIPSSQLFNMRTDMQNDNTQNTAFDSTDFPL